MNFKDYFHNIYLENHESGFFYMYHGGTMNKNDHAPSKGRWEYGPGLYLTNSYELARKYGKGGRKVYKCKIAIGKDLSSSYIPTDAVSEFIDLYGGSKKKDYRSFLVKYNKDGMFPANVLVNLAVNNDMRSSSAKALRQFLVEHGVDYEWNRWTGRNADTYILTLYDDTHLLEFRPVTQISTDELMLPIPK